MAIIDRILKLTRQLYPRGRAFNYPLNGILDKTHRALALSEERLYNDNLAIFNSILPDNEDFTLADAADWERRLGLITNNSVSLENRKLAILRKINHPGNIRARQHRIYVETQLRAAAFDVYVYENKFRDSNGNLVTRRPEQVGGGGGVPVQLGDWQMGDRQMGNSVRDSGICVNHIDERIDRLFNVGGNLRSTFFIGGAPLGEFATVQQARRDEFRQLILRLKPAQTVAYLFINYE